MQTVQKAPLDLVFAANCARLQQLDQSCYLFLLIFLVIRGVLLEVCDGISSGQGCLGEEG